MKRRLWLYGLIERLMDNPDSSLHAALDWLCRAVRSDIGVIYLHEYDWEDEHCVSLRITGVVVSRWSKRSLFS